MRGRIFTPEHELWRAADAADRLDDWLPYAEDLIRKWASQGSNEVEFSSTWQIVIAGSALKDGLLPASATIAFSELMSQLILEAESKKFHLDCLHLAPSKRGRKKDREQRFQRLHEVNDLLRKGVRRIAAYEIVAKNHFKSSDTIRREFERYKKAEKVKGEKRFLISPVKSRNG